MNELQSLIFLLFCCLALNASLGFFSGIMIRKNKHCTNDSSMDDLKRLLVLVGSMIAIASAGIAFIAANNYMPEMCLRKYVLSLAGMTSFVVAMCAWVGGLFLYLFYEEDKNDNVPNPTISQ